MKELLQFAETIVREAGDAVRGMTTHSGTRWTKDEGDLVTDGDLLVQEHILGRIKYAYPQHGIISEEDEDRSPDHEFAWILDPIDGTKYFARNVSLYGISLALRVGEELTVGVVQNPETGETFCAARDLGATLNSTAITCSDQKELAESIICAEMPSRHASPQELEWALERFGRLVNICQRVRIVGVSSLSLCWTAMGGFDAYVNLGSSSKIWDIAAGHVILRESGAQITSFGRHVIAGPSILHEQLQQVLKFSADDPQS